MNKRAFAVAATCLGGSWAFAQQWVQQSPFPTGMDLNGIAFASPTHGFTVGEALTVKETFDGGATWRSVPIGFGTGEPFYSVAFRDPQSAFITGNTGTEFWNHFRSLDAGATWQMMSSVPGGSWYHIDFTDTNTGFLGGNGALVKTTNGGASWQLKSAYPNCPVIFGMDFKDAQTGLAGGIMAGTSVEGIFKTTDGGQTWAQKHPNSANDVIWMNPTTAIAIVSTSILRSTDGGETWSEFGFGIDTGLLDMEKVDGSTVVGVSGKGDIWRSADSGASWTKVLDGIGDLPASWSINFSDPNNGWIAGQGGLMYKTSDGGFTWQQMNNGMGTQIYEIEMLNSSYGLAAGENGYIFKTTNGGAHWDIAKVGVTGQIFGRDETLRSVSVVDTQFAVVAGPGGTVFKTEDGAQTWQNIGYPYLPELWIETVEFTSHTEGWIAGQDLDLGHDKTIYHTTDGGLSWTLGPRIGAYFYAMDFADALHGCIFSAGGAYLRTADGGGTWQYSYLPVFWLTPSVSDIEFADANVGWVVGWDGLVAKTTNAGATWTYQTIATDDHMFTVTTVSPTEVWISGRNQNYTPVLYHTTNAGTTWVRSVPPSYDWLYTLSAAGGSVWGAGYGGIIYKLTSPQTVSPSSFTVAPGLVISGALSSLANSDDNRLVVRPGVVFSNVQAPIQLQLDATSPFATPTALKFSLEGHSTATGVSQKVELFDYVAGSYLLIDTRAASGGDTTIELTPMGSAARFVEPGTLHLRARLSWRATAPVSSYPWLVRVDRAAWLFTP